MKASLFYCFYDSPVGRLILSGTESALSGLWISGEKHAPGIGETWVRNESVFAEARRQLDEYFAGTRRAFDLPLAAGGTDFQQRVWAGLCRIPFGSTRSYGQLAVELGSPKGMRAVGLANGKNPISIVVPCHRVIGADNSLTGYGGGLAAKRWLLEHEGLRSPELFPVGAAESVG